MNILFKLCLWVSFCIFFTLLFIGQVPAKEMLVESSITAGKEQPPQKSLGELFTELGLTPPPTGFINPCFDIEEYSRKYCTTHALTLLLAEDSMAEIEKQFLRKMMLHDSACEQVALYIGRLCQQENFKKIFRHFSLQK